MTTCSHPIPVEAPLRPSPLSSPSNEQAHHMRLLMPCRYDCEQNNLVDEENCGSFDCGLRIADCGFIESENHAVIAAPLAQDSSLTVNPQSAIRNPQSPEIRVSLRPSVVGLQAESIRRRADTYVGMRESPGASSTKKKTVRISRLPQG